MGDAPLRPLQRRAELMGMASPLYYSADMVRALPEDGQRYETVHGELLVTPAPTLWHQEIVARLLERLRAYLRVHPVAHAMASPADISWGPDSLVQPDLFVIRLDEARTMDWSRIRQLLLAVEVLSPSSLRADRFTKRRLYQEMRVRAYWVVNPDRKEIEVWTPEATFPTLVTDRVRWELQGADAPFELDMEELFRPL